MIDMFIAGFVVGVGATAAVAALIAHINGLP